MLNRAAQVAKPLLVKLGFLEESLSPFIRQYTSLADLADVVATAFKLEDDSEPLPEFDDLLAGDRSKVVTQASVMEGAVRELLDPIESQIDAMMSQLSEPDDVADAVANNGSAVQANTAPDVSAASVLPSLVDAMQRLGGQPEAVVQHLGHVMDATIKLTPVDGHQGKCNRRTIRERLTLQNRTGYGEQSSWFLESVVFVRDKNVFARVITVFEKAYGCWVPDGTCLAVVG